MTAAEGSSTPAERQVLAVVSTLEHLPRDWTSGRRLRPTFEALVRHGRLLLGAELLPWDEAVASLVAGGQLDWRGQELHLTHAGRPRAEVLRRRFAARGFGLAQLRCAASPAWAELCRRVHGPALEPFSLLDEAQLAHLLAFLAIPQGALVLDVGCGLGHVGDRVGSLTGARVVGLDLALPALEHAAGRSRAGGRKVLLLAADLEHFELAPQSFAAAFAIDVIYFLDELPAVLARLARVLEAGGRLGMLASEVAADRRTARRLPAGSRLTLALAAAGFEAQTTDVTEHEIALWQRQREALEELGPRFEAEGNGEIAVNLWRETERTLGWIRAGRVRRFLYGATATGAGSSKG